MSDAEDIDYLSAEDLIEVAAGVLGAGLQIRDAGLLTSAAARPMTIVFGNEAYPTFALKASALVHSLARNPPLVDGNRRLARSAMRTFCLLNGRDIRYSVDEAERFVSAVAAGELDLPQIATWVDARLIDAEPPVQPRS